jgi:chemotaxis signal transduction protein
VSEQKPDGWQEATEIDADLEMALAAFGDDLRELLDEDDDNLDPACQNQPAEPFHETADQADRSGDPLTALLERYGDRLKGDSKLAFAGSIAVACSEASDAMAGHDSRCIVFTLGGQRLAVPLRAVVEVAACPAITPLPRTADWLCGVAMLRGKIVSVTDLARLLQLERETEAGSKLVVLNSRYHGSTTALLVDRLQGIRKLPALTAPDTESLAGRFARGMAEDEDTLVTVLDPDKLLGSPELGQYMK